MNIPRTQLAAVYAMGKVYAVGGLTVDPMTPDGLALVNSVEVYDPQTNVWRLLRQGLEVARRHHAAVVYNNCVWVVGGITANSTFLPPRIEVFNITAGTWFSLSDSSAMVYGTSFLGDLAFRGASLAQSRNEIIAYGGVNMLAYTIDTPSSLNQNKWRIIGSDYLNQSWAAFGVVGVPGMPDCIGLVLGGCDDVNCSTASTANLAYNVVTGNAFFLSDMPTARFNAFFGVVNNTVIVAGGISTGGITLSAVERYTFEVNPCPGSPRLCSGNGTCDFLTGKCNCKFGYYMDDCSLFRNWEVKDKYPPGTGLPGMGIVALNMDMGVATGPGQGDDYLFAIGGRNDTLDTATNATARYSAKYDWWRNMSTLLVGRSDFATCQVASQLFVVGGSTPTMFGFRTFVKVVEMYDSLDGQWKGVTNTSLARSGHAMVPYMSNLLVFGGRYRSSTGITAVKPEDFTEMYNISSGEWSKGPWAAESKRPFDPVSSPYAAVAISNVAYLFWMDVDRGSIRLAALNMTTGVWQLGAQLEVDRKGLYSTLCAAAVYGKIYVASDASLGRDYFLYIYDTVAGKWGVGPMFEPGWTPLGLAAVGNRVLVTQINANQATQLVQHATNAEPCPNACSGHGACNLFSFMCECEAEYALTVDCSQFSPAVKVPPNLLLIVAVPVLVTAVIVMIAAAVFFRVHERVRVHLSPAVWQIDYTDLLLSTSIGQGSFGVVRRATFRGSQVAVKTLLQQNVSDALQNEFKSETAVMCDLRHPNIVLFMGACIKPPNLCIVTELMDRSLYDLIHDHSCPMDLSDVIRFAADTARGMNYLHSAKPPILHNDLKSPNLLLDKNQVVKVCDFGLTAFKVLTREPVPPTSLRNRLGRRSRSRSVFRAISNKSFRAYNRLQSISFSASSNSNSSSKPNSNPSSKPNSNPTTPRRLIAAALSPNPRASISPNTSSSAQKSSCSVLWASPEVLNDMPHSEKADVYSFGIVLWELLTRQQPYEQMEAFAVPLAVLKGTRPPVPTWAPPIYGQLMSECWHEDPEQRPSFDVILNRLETMHLHLAKDVLHMAATELQGSDKTVPKWVVPVDRRIATSEVSLGRKIGSGGFGEVFEAEFRSMPVAVKKLLPTKLIEKNIEGFHAEIALMCQLHHPHICLLLGASVDPPDLFLVTELMPRGSMDSLLHHAKRARDEQGEEKLKEVDKSGKGGMALLPWEVRGRMLLEAALGIEYLHKHTPPIIHRDLKTNNLLVDEEWHVKISDFGLARLKAENKVMTAVGTMAWTAPEVFLGQQYSEKADVYSFGIIMWELLALEQPFQDMGGFQVAMRVSQDDLRPPIPEKHDAPEDYISLMTACWSRSPDDRPAFSDIIVRLRLISNATRTGSSLIGPPVLPTLLAPAVLSRSMRVRSSVKNGGSSRWLTAIAKSNGQGQGQGLVNTPSAISCQLSEEGKEPMTLNMRAEVTVSDLLQLLNKSRTPANVINTVLDEDGYDCPREEAVHAFANDSGEVCLTFVTATSRSAARILPMAETQQTFAEQKNLRVSWCVAEENGK